MYSFTTILFCLGLAEAVRRCCIMLLKAFTGPMSKIPGPWLWKFSTLPWTRVVLQGNQINVSPKLFATYGDVVRIAPNEIIVCSKNATQKVIVEEDMPKSPNYETVREEPHITNLFTERDNVAYKQKRRLLSSGFSISYINGLEPLMQDCMQMFTTALQMKCSESNGHAVVDFARLLANLTFDVMSATSFGGSFELVRTDDAKTRRIFQDRLIKAATQSQFPWLKYIPFAPTAYSPDMDKMIEGIVSKRRKAMEKGESKKDLLQIFLDAHDANPNEYTMKHVYDEMRLFMIAGSDTTSATAQFAILLLLSNPSKLHRLVSEIDTAFPNPNDDITIARTQNLEYLNACINESMRIKPIVVGGLPRITEKPTVLDGFEVPSGVLVTAYIDLTMRDPRIWSVADQFVPERWLQPNEVDRKAFIPFSSGLRNCIGQQFALKELRLILVTLLRKFELNVVEGQDYEMRVFTVPYLKQGKYLVGVKPRV